MSRPTIQELREDILHAPPPGTTGGGPRIEAVIAVILLEILIELHEMNEREDIKHG